MKFYNTIKSLQEDILRLKNKTTIGFVPTMGALHKGHLSLIKRAKKENKFVVVSIFVNPTQFDKKEDLDQYPRTLEKDLELLESVDCDAVFVPLVDDIYNDQILAVNFDFDGLEFEMEGKHRLGHFNGVGTIVKKLFDIVKPNKAYFGEKDFQQLQIIRNMVKKNHIPVDIIGCKIFREKDGLAMSSRNVRLSEEQRKMVPFIYKTLKKAKKKFKENSIPEVLRWVQKEFENNSVLKLEYFEIANIETLKPSKRKSKKVKYRGFIAAFAGNVRLIDNIALN
ncbi:MAG: pantoate--beta-alanine ligase [Bacteroidia bacterium]|nr:pantoate--beta-alanine ligase [Bacteroidia bacterium]